MLSSVRIHEYLPLIFINEVLLLTNVTCTALVIRIKPLNTNALLSYLDT